MTHRSARVLACVLALVAAPAAEVAAQGLAPKQAMDPISVGQRAAPDVSIRLMGAFATLKIVAWAHDSIALTGAIPRGARFETGLGAPGPRGLTGAKMFLESADPRAPAVATLELRVPAQARVWVKGITGEIEATGIAGELDLNVLGGRVSVAGSPRVLHIEAIEAAVTVDGAPEWARIKTAEGDVTVNGGGTDLGVTTVSGAVRVAGGHVERLRIETVSGRASVSSGLTRGATIGVDTHSGAVELILDRTVDADIRATTTAGVIQNSVSSRAPVPGRDGRGSELLIDAGAGASARITIGSYRGNIRLARR